MTAKEAKEITEQNKYIKRDNLWKSDIDAAIFAAAKRGSNHVQISPTYGMLKNSERLVQHYTSLGFNISCTNFYVFVNWAE